MSQVSNHSPEVIDGLDHEAFDRILLELDYASGQAFPDEPWDDEDRNEWANEEEARMLDELRNYGPRDYPADQDWFWDQARDREQQAYIGATNDRLNAAPEQEGVPY